MRGWTIPLGRWMGVEMRVHVFFPALALVCLGLSTSDGIVRGLGLFFIWVSAVVVRETARLMMAAYLDLQAACSAFASDRRTFRLRQP